MLPLTFPMMERFDALVAQNVITRENVDRFFKNPSEFLGDGGFEIPIDFNASLVEMIVACRFDFWSKSEFTPVRFPIAGAGVIEVRLHLVRLYCNTTDEEVTQELDARNLADAGIVHLLACAKKFPELQRQFPIHARDSFYLDDYHNRCEPYLFKLGSGRGLFTGSRTNGEGFKCGSRILAIGK